MTSQSTQKRKNSIKKATIDPEPSQEVQPVDDGVENTATKSTVIESSEPAIAESTAPGSAIVKTTAETGNDPLKPIRAAIQKQGRRSKRFQALFTEHTYNALHRISKLAGISVNEILNVILELHLNDFDLEKRSDEEISAILHGESNAN